MYNIDYTVCVRGGGLVVVLSARCDQHLVSIEGTTMQTGQMYQCQLMSFGMLLFVRHCSGFEGNSRRYDYDFHSLVTSQRFYSCISKHCMTISAKICPISFPGAQQVPPPVGQFALASLWPQGGCLM